MANRVAGVSTPAFVERVMVGANSILIASVSPGSRPRPSLSGARTTRYRNNRWACRRGLDPGLR